MNIFADENIPQQIATQQCAAGHKVEYVMQQVEDRIILEEAYKQRALLITTRHFIRQKILLQAKNSIFRKPIKDQPTRGRISVPSKIYQKASRCEI
jgi:hypothetical protein